MAVLKLFVLGPPRLERAGRPIELPLRRAAAVLVYLAVTGRPKGRDSLAALLWSESDERAARARLRRTLHRLSEAIGDEALLAEADTLRLAPGADLWLDSRAFEEHAAAALRSDTGVARPTIEQLARATEAAALYVDDFLAGFALPDSSAWDEWQFLER